jgi:hypothetical protein
MTVDGSYTQAELEELGGVTLFEPPYDIPVIQSTIQESNQQSSRGLSELLFAAFLLSVGSRSIPGMIYAGREESYFLDGRALSPNEMRARVLGEAQQNAASFERLMGDLVSGKISLSQFQERGSLFLLQGHLRMAQAGAGTASRFGEAHAVALRQRLQNEIGRMMGISNQFANGEISDRMALWLSRRLGQGTGVSFGEAQRISHSDGRWLGRRWLGGNNNHCPDCPNHQTDGWVPAENIVPIGADCVCNSFCQCQVEYRSISLSDRLPGL